MNSNRKGKAAEREVANLLKKNGFEEARRSQQYNGLGDADIVGLEHLHIEVKRVEKLNIYKAIEQAEKECEGLIPCVVHRKNNFEWHVTMSFADWIEFYKAWKKENPIRVIKQVE